MGNAPPCSDPINLMRGWPHPSLLPTTLIKRAAATVLSDPTIAHPGLLYGPDAGYEPARVAIANWLTSFYTPPSPISSNRICVTGGASQNLGCMLSVYTDPEYTRRIWILAPAYMLAFRVFEDAGFAGKMRGVAEDMDLEGLRKEMEKSMEGVRNDERPRFKPQRNRAKVYRHIIYCVPTFANPSSRTMSLERRQGLVRLAREFDALIIPDDVYDFLQWPAEKGGGVKVLQQAHLPRLVDIDRELDGGAERKGADGFGNACSNGSFSKIAGPGLRVGWVEGTEKFAYGVSQTGTTASGGAPSQLTSTYLTHLLTTQSLQHHITTTLLPAYSLRYHTLTTAIQIHLIPLGFALPPQQPSGEKGVMGGYFVWLSLPKPLRATALAARCADEGEVVIAPGPIFAVPGDEGVGFEGFMRLCFAWVDEGELAEGVRRVGEVAGRMLVEGGSGGNRGEGEMGMEMFK